MNTTSPQEGKTRMAAGIIRRTLIATLLVVAIGSVWAQAAPAQVPAPPGGPVLVVTDPADPFGQYYGEILRAEGLNEFAIANVGSLNAQTLAAYQVVVLAETDLTAAQVSALTTWVNGGGNLIAMRPDASLAGLLGLGSDVGDLANGYLQVAPGRGITGETMQFHGTADLWTGGGGATVAATLFSNASTSTGRPAVTLRTRRRRPGRRVHLRPRPLGRLHAPGQPGLGRPGARRPTAPIRSDDMFFGAGQPTWVDFNKVAIPQADEQQRLLAEPDHADERGPHAAAALLVPAARREGGGDHDRRRPRQRRHQRPVRPSSRPRARRAARSRTGSASARRPTSSRSTTIAECGRVPGGRLRDRPAPRTRAAATSRRRRSAATGTSSCSTSRDGVPGARTRR